MQFRKVQPDPCFSPYRRDSERALTRFAALNLTPVLEKSNLTPVFVFRQFVAVRAECVPFKAESLSWSRNVY